MTEKLSNLMDKNVADSDLDLFLQDCTDDPSLIDSWQRYHLAGSVICNEISESDLKYDIAAKVMARLESEQLKSDHPGTKNSNVLPLTSNKTLPAVARLTSTAWFPLAIAASLLLGVYFIITQPVVETTPVQLAENEAAENTASSSIDHWQTASAEIEEALNALLVEHSEFTSVTGMNGLGSYSKFIAYQN